MDWMKTHEYLAAWMNLPLMIVLTIVQRWRGNGEPVNMARTTLYLTFLTSLAVVLSPVSDVVARYFAMTLCFTLLWVIVPHAK
jgi:hypothetical protein